MTRPRLHDALHFLPLSCLLLAHGVASMTCAAARDHFDVTCCGRDLESTLFWPEPPPPPSPPLPPPTPPAPPAPPPAPPAPIEWTFDTTYDDDSISVLQARRMARLVSLATDGRFRIVVAPSSPGGGFGRVARGESQMGTAYLSAFGALGVFDTDDPLLVWDNVPVAAMAPSVADAVTRWSDDVEAPFRELYASVAPPNTVLLGGLPSPGQGFFLNRTLPPDEPADFAGLTVRCYSAPVGQLTKALNMTCSPRILQSAIPQAFDDGLIHGLWGSADTVVAKQLWTKGLKTFVALRTFYPFIYTVAHRPSYERLDPAAREALDVAWRDVWANTTSVVEEREALGDVTLAANGIETVASSDPRLAALSAAADQVRSTWAV